MHCPDLWQPTAGISCGWTASFFFLWSWWDWKNWYGSRNRDCILWHLHCRCLQIITFPSWSVSFWCFILFFSFLHKKVENWKHFYGLHGIPCWQGLSRWYCYCRRSPCFLLPGLLKTAFRKRWSGIFLLLRSWGVRQPSLQVIREMITGRICMPGHLPWYWYGCMCWTAESPGRKKFRVCWCLSFSLWALRIISWIISGMVCIFRRRCRADSHSFTFLCFWSWDLQRSANGKEPDAGISS